MDSAPRDASAPTGTEADPFRDIGMGGTLVVGLYSAPEIVDFDGDGDVDFAVPTTGVDYDPFPGEENFVLWNSNGKLFQDYGTKETHN